MNQMRLVILGASGMVGGYVLRVIYPVFRALFPNQVIRADDLGRAMVDVTIRKRGEREHLVFENRDIRAMVESYR